MSRRIGATGLTTISSVSKHAINDDTEGVGTDLGDNDERIGSCFHARAPSIGALRIDERLFKVQQIPEVDERQKPIAQAQDRRFR